MCVRRRSVYHDCGHFIEHPLETCTNAYRTGGIAGEACSENPITMNPNPFSPICDSCKRDKVANKGKAIAEAAEGRAKEWAAELQRQGEVKKRDALERRIRA